MRVVIHGFGSFPAFFYYVIKYAKKINAPIEWAIILTSDHYEKLFIELLGSDRVTVWDQSGSNFQDINQSEKYPGDLYRDIESDKRSYKHMSAERQYKRAMCMYVQTKNFMEKFKPSHALVSQVEGYDGKVFIATAKEINAEVVVPTSCRSIGGIYFSSDDIETLPKYANNIDDKSKKLAEEFISAFLQSPTEARWLLEYKNDTKLSDFKPNIFVRLNDTLKRWVFTPGAFQWDYLRASILNNLPLVRNLIWSTRKYLNQKIYNIKTIDELPKKFIFYPLQYSPESSINTPAPYFLDQFRAIDAIRFSMPSDCILVVKEHPACILLRNSQTVKKLLNTAGVRVINYKASSIEIIKRADLTISVTGTAILESVLIGKQPIALGPGIGSELIGEVTSLDSLTAKIKSSLGQRYDVDTLVMKVAKIYRSRFEVAFGSPGMKDEPILRKANIEKFFDSLIEHCEHINMHKMLVANK